MPRIHLCHFGFRLWHRFSVLSVGRTSVRCMSSGVPSDREAIAAALDRLEAAHAEVASLSFDALTAPELLNVMDRLEAVYRRQPAVNHQLIHQLTSPRPPRSKSAANHGERCCNADADRPRPTPAARLNETEDLGPRRALDRRAVGAQAARWWRPHKPTGRSAPNTCVSSAGSSPSCPMPSTTRLAKPLRPTWPASPAEHTPRGTA